LQLYPPIRWRELGFIALAVGIVAFLAGVSS
jgi:hypothetical protein